MKKTITAFLLLCMAALTLPAFADTYDNRVQGIYPENAPRWTDYVPQKYQNPRTDYSKKTAITQIVVGTLAIPFTIPFLCMGTTKLKNISYAEKKQMFFNGLNQAAMMTPQQQQQYYPQLLQQCGLTKKQK